MKRALELLQELSSMINSDKYPKMDGSHRLDHWKANKMIIEIVNEVKQVPKVVETDQDAYLADIRRFSKLMSIAAIELLRLDSCDDAELGKLYLQVCKSIKGINDVILSIENPPFTQAKATVPDQTRQQVREYTDLKDQIHELATALSDLHDIQSRAPLTRDREEYAAVMVRVVEVLDKVGY